MAWGVERARKDRKGRITKKFWVVTVVLFWLRLVSGCLHMSKFNKLCLNLYSLLYFISYNSKEKKYLEKKKKLIHKIRT